MNMITLTADGPPSVFIWRELAHRKENRRGLDFAAAIPWFMLFF
jgi:hypothetical protein